MLRRIVAALSGTPYTPTVIDHAVELAERHDAELTGVTVINAEAVADVGPVPMGAGAFASNLARHRWEVSRERVDEVVAQFEETCGKAGVRHRVVREEGDPFEALVSLWRYHDFTVLELQGFFEYGVVKHPDDWLKNLVKVGVRPILAVAPEKRDIRRVMIAYNGSMESAKAMKRVVQMRPWAQMDLKLVAFEIPEIEAKRLLEEAAGYCRAHGYEPEIGVYDSPPSQGLLEEAENWEADLIALGATRRRRLFSRPLGDTALYAIRNSPLPLLLMQ